MLIDEQFREWASLAANVLEGLGIVAVLLGVLVSAVLAVRNLVRRSGDVFESLRRHLGRSILLGLEFLVAGDIVRTVAVEPTLENVGVLAIIVLVRTGLSFVLELEITGRWPWQARAEPPYRLSTRRSPASTSRMMGVGSRPIGSTMWSRSSVSTSVAITTESFGNPLALVGTKTFPGMPARAVLLEIAATTTVPSRERV